MLKAIMQVLILASFILALLYLVYCERSREARA